MAFPSQLGLVNPDTERVCRNDGGHDHGWARRDHGWVRAEPDAAEIALAEHAHYLATRGRWRFLVASGDHRLAGVADYGELHVLIWEGHPLSARLESAALAVHRLPRPGARGSGR